MPLLALVPRILLTPPPAAGSRLNAPPVVRPSFPARPDRLHVASAPKRRASKKPARTPAPARKPAKHPAPPPSKPSPASDWVIGPYGDLMSRAEYEALIKSQADA